MLPLFSRIKNMKAIEQRPMFQFHFSYNDKIEQLGNKIILISILIN